MINTYVVILDIIYVQDIDQIVLEFLFWYLVAHNDQILRTEGL